MMGHKTEWPDDGRRARSAAVRHSRRTAVDRPRGPNRRERIAPGTWPRVARSNGIGWNDSNRSASGGRFPNRRPRRRTGVSPDSCSRSGRPSILCARVTNPEASRSVRVCKCGTGCSLGPPPAALHEPNNLVTRSAGPASMPDRAGLRAPVALAGTIRPAAGARHGRRAFTTDSRGGLSQWYGGRLGRLVSWHGP